MIRVHDVLAGTNGQINGALDPQKLLRAVTHDSREVQEGDLFIALVGETQDGHRFVPDALERGARAVMINESFAQQFSLGDLPAIVVPDTLVALQSLAAYWRNTFSPHVIGITGSIGKSSTKEVIAGIAGARFNVTRSRRSYNSEVGLPLSVLELTPDTEVLVLELGGGYRFGEISELAAIARPTIGVVTNVSHSHLGRMGSLEAIAETKTELVTSLPPDGVAILNVDDERVRAMAERATSRVIFYGLGDDANVRATDLQSHGVDGISFRLHHPGGSDHVQVPLMGRHSVHMALAGFAVGVELGLDLEEMIRGIATPGIQLRLLLVRSLNGSTLLDDTYNANPASSFAALALLAELDADRRIAVFGDMMELGDFEIEGHTLVGERAAQTVDRLYTLGARARIIAARAREAAPGLPVSSFESKEELIEALTHDLRQGDVVLVKGSRSVQMETIVAALRVPEPAERVE